MNNTLSGFRTVVFGYVKDNLKKNSSMRRIK